MVNLVSGHRTDHAVLNVEEAHKQEPENVTHPLLLELERSVLVPQQNHESAEREIAQVCSVHSVR